jgi:hypothetical protein
MNVDVSVDSVIDRSVGAVSTYAANPDNAPAWYVNIKAVEWKTPPPLAVGSRVSFVAQFLGRRMAYTYEIVDLVPGQRLTCGLPKVRFPWKQSTRGSRRQMAGRI